MNNPWYRYIFGHLFIVLISIFAPVISQQDAQASFISESTNSVQARNFAPGRLDEHYLKHGYQFGHITEEQYLEDAQALLDASPGKDVLEKIRPDGDIEHFRVSTGEFAVMTKRGRIRTYFKTDYAYWIWRQ